MRIPIVSLFACAAAFGVSHSLAGLAAYDARISADNAGGLPYIALSTETLTFDTTNSQPFDYGAVTGSSTIEFILTGDPVAGGQNGYLGVGANATFSLRYEQWDNTGVLGFTHGGVADYVFAAPPAPDNPASNSPTEPTHVTYRWDQPTATMDLYINGVLSGTQVAGGFQMPAGSGLLGNNAGLTEGMLGTIERVTIYDEAVDPGTIATHAEAWNGPGGSLANYDATIANDHAGPLPHTAISTTPLTFDTTNSAPFDFGAVSDSATAEFIVSGDPVAGGQDGFLAVGADPTFSLRFEQWSDTGKLGFTQSGVADYLFAPPGLPQPGSLASPTELTHVAYRWDQATTTMELYLNGVLSGVNAAAPGFEMPTGAGHLGNNAGLTEGMLGVMERVTVYNEAISPEDILAHANAWLGSDMTEPFVFTEILVTVDPRTDVATVTLTWNSRPATRYKVEFSDDLIGWQEIDDSYPSGGETTEFTHIFGSASGILHRYYRVSEAPL